MQVVIYPLFDERRFEANFGTAARLSAGSKLQIRHKNYTIIPRNYSLKRIFLTYGGYFYAIAEISCLLNSDNKSTQCTYDISNTVSRLSTNVFIDIMSKFIFL